MGDSPRKVRGVGESTKQKVGRLWFGGRCLRISRGIPEAWSRLFVCRASFLMTFAMGGAPAPGSYRISVELFQILKDDAVESASLNMQYAICTQYAICQLPAVCFLLLLFVVYSFLCCVSPLIFKSQSLEEVESTTIPWLWRTLGWQALSHRLREDFADTENSHYWEKWELLGRTKESKACSLGVKRWVDSKKSIQ